MCKDGAKVVREADLKKYVLTIAMLVVVSALRYGLAVWVKQPKHKSLVHDKHGAVAWSQQHLEQGETLRKTDKSAINKIVFGKLFISSGVA